MCVEAKGEPRVRQENKDLILIFISKNEWKQSQFFEKLLQLFL